METLSGQSQVVVRQGAVNDVPAARALILLPLNYDPVWHRDIDDFEEEYARSPRQAFFVAMVDGALAGACVVRHRLPPAVWIARRYLAGVTCELGRVVVAERYRRRGLALQLVEAARRWALQAGFSTVHLHTAATNAPALDLWRSVATELTPPAGTDRDPDTVFFELPISLPVRKRATPLPGGYVVRLAAGADLEGARDLMLRVLTEDYGYGYQPHLHADIADLAQHYRPETRQALAVAVDERTGQVIACGCIQLGGRFPQPRPDSLVAHFPANDTGELTRVFTAREHRRRGAARDVVELLRRWAVDAGYRHVVLHTNTARDGAERFWRSTAVELFDARPTTFNTVHFELPLERQVPGSHPERFA